MDFYSFLLCIPFLLCIHFLFTTAIFNRIRRLPPGPTGLPILGSLLTIGSSPHESLAKLAKTYGPIMTVKFGMVNVVIASSADLAKEILQKNDLAFIGRPTPEAVAAEIHYDMSLVWSSGLSPHWKKLRKICNTQLFTAQKLDALRDTRHRMMRKMIERVEEAREAREALNFGMLFFGTTMNFISNTIFSGDMFDMKSDMMSELKELITQLMELAGRMNIADFVPLLKPFDPQGIKREIKVVYERVHTLFEDIITQRVRQRGIGSERRGDFLDVLLDHAEEHGAEELTHQNIKILFLDLFTGATHTTTTASEWAMAELLRNPPILAKLKQEISHIIPPGNLVQEQDIPHFRYLDAIIKETLRLHPIAPLLAPHLTEQRVELHGYIIPKHTQVLVNIWSIQMDSAHWTDPTSFKPNRFVDMDIDTRGKDCKYIPFGTGRRICPGANLAIRMVSLILANLVHSFDWELPNGMNPEDVDMKNTLGLTLQKLEPLMAIPVNVN